MATEVIVPKLGMAAAVATLTEWRAQEGQAFRGNAQPEEVDREDPRRAPE